ncbi:MAG: hypothetical protein L0K86_11885 [Actinomycetia bacterium]|nr:hypothetical protein [Actinomycetes bacterium]
MFTRTDRDKAVWFEVHERERCPSCGTRADEWDPAKGGHDDAYVWELRKCWGCHTKAEGEKRIKDSHGAGVTVALTRNPDAR